MTLRGIFPIVATPFALDGSVDEAGLRRVVRFCLDCGVHGLVWPAVASEFYSLSDDERKRFLRAVIDETAGRVPVVAGVSGCSGPVAVAFTLDAVQAGADAVMALPPYVVKDSIAGIRQYYRQICAAADGRPVILQNAPPPLGQGLAAAAVVGLVNDVPGLNYVKEETVPSGHALSRVLSDTAAKLAGAFGGGGGRYLIEEHDRGACGAMPACEYADVFVTIWDHLESRRADKARSVFQRLLPLLFMQAALRMSFTKEVLRRRGVLQSTALRIEADMVFDEVDHAQLDALSTRIAADLRTAVPS